MKKFTNLLIVASLALAGAVMAQPPSPEESPSKKSEKKQPAAAPRAPKSEAPAVKEPAATPAPSVPKLEKKAPKPAPLAPAAMEKKTSAEEPAVSATPAAKKEQRSKETMKPAASATPAAPKSTATPAAKAIATPTAKTTSTPAAKTTPTPAAATMTTPTPAAAKTTPTPAAPASATPAAAKATATPAAAVSATPATTASASAAPSVAQTSPTTATVNPSAPKKPDAQVVLKIRERHANFHAQPRPDRVPAVTFSANFRIQGSDRWQGPQYEVYRSYRPERHDRGWYHSRYKRVELIGGGYYYWNNGYWSPAWGYSPAEEYYAYDAPIYVGPKAEPPDKVIAQVQSALQEMGYYKGEVDGLLGPLTRDALTGYQNDQGLTATAVIDEPTLNSLGMG